MNNPDPLWKIKSMDAASVSVLWYRRSKPQGKVRRRVQDLRIPSCSYYDFNASRPTLDLSHNESTRLAADSLLSRGLEGYHEVLSAEGEVDFLSELEKIYILDNGRDGSTADPGASDDDGKELKSFSAGSQSATRCPAMSTDSEPTAAGVKTADHVLDEPKFEVYFHSDSRAAGMKDLVREFIRKATMDLAIVMDSFSDAELLCDLLEASRKRNVSVYLLLDHLNLNLFVSMWQELKLDSKNFPKLSVRSVAGQTYCAKTGRKLTGQIAESFIITDWTEVLTGSYSFSWLSWQVHRSLAVLVTGSAVIPFHQEFHRLNSSSKPVPGFVTYISVPQTLPLYTTLNAAQNDNTVKKSNQCINATMQRPHRAGTGTQMHENPPQLYPTPLVEPGALQSAAGGKPKHTVGPVCSQHCAQTNTEPLKKNQNQIQTHITAAERNTMGQESNPPHTDLPAHRQNRSVHYQSPVKTHSNLEHYNEVPEGVFSQQRNHDRLIKPLGIAEALNTQRRQWYCPLNFKAKVDFVSDRPKLQTHSASQQTQAKMGFLLPLSNQRGPIHGLQANVSSLGTRRQNESTAEAPGSKSAPTVMGAHRKPQLQSDSKMFSQGPGTNLHPHPHPAQQVKPPPRLNWMPQSHTTRPRPVARHHSFGTTYGMGQQAGWRTFHSSMNASLGRSKSMNERHSAGFRGAGLNPNITKT